LIGMERSVETIGSSGTTDKGACEFIATLPEDVLCRITAFPPSLDFAEPFYRHAAGCTECAARINSAQQAYTTKLHPELVLPEEEARLRKRMLDLIEKHATAGNGRGGVILHKVRGRIAQKRSCQS
jgi:hypothetical protein